LEKRFDRFIEPFLEFKARWSCEQAHQQLKEDLGLDHFEGRSWRGLYNHALMTLICFAFLQQERLREDKSAA
jgi:SRSO17 transposase